MKVMIEGKEYWRDAKGNLTPAELVKEIDKARDALVHEWVERGRDLSKAISHFKEGILVMYKLLLSFLPRNMARKWVVIKAM